jgi:hypothetical protein
VRVVRVDVTAQDPVSLRQAYGKLFGEASGGERFTLKRGEIQVASANSQDGIHSVTLGIGDLGSIARGWEAQQVPFHEEVIPGCGSALVPMATAGARILVVKN